MAGLTEYRGDRPDSFWTWRERDVPVRRPDQPGTAVRHRRPAVWRDAGSRLSPRSANSITCTISRMARRMTTRPRCRRRSSAPREDAGIGLTLLPVLYQTGGFDGRALAVTAQRRFGHSTEAYLRLIEQPAAAGKPSAEDRRGPAQPARGAGAIAWPNCCRNWRRRKLPIHIHIAEQMAEVQRMP